MTAVKKILIRISLILISVFLNDGNTHVIYAKEGTPTTLPSDHKTLKQCPGTWTNATFHIIAKNGDTNFTEKYRHRLQMDNSSKNLYFKYVIPEDTGKYLLWCDWNKSYFLNVLPSVHAPVIEYKESSPDGVFVECCVNDSRVANLTWYRNSKILSNKSSSGLNSTTCLPLNISKSDESNYTCEAANPVSRSSTEASRPKQPENSSPDVKWKSVTIKLVVSVLVVSLLLFLVYCCRRRCRKWKSQNVRLNGNGPSQNGALQLFPSEVDSEEETQV